MILSGIRARIYSCLNLVPGTIARPNCPNGKRALFYRDAQGVHRPLLDHLKMKMTGRDNIRDRIGFLGGTEYFQQMLGIDERTTFLPKALRRLVFDNNKLATWKRIAVEKHWDVVWDSEGVKSYFLAVEPKTGTLFMKPGVMARIAA
jgi:hypothetical protein